MPDYDDKGNVLTVQDMSAENSLGSALSFSELDAAIADGDVDAADVYGDSKAVEGNDLSNYRGVSEEYRTYATEVDSPLDFDASVADNSQEKLDALTEQAGEEADADDSDKGDRPSPRKATAKNSKPPIPTSNE